ncbi:conserved hypothetical protein [gamma proteobacterium HTCC5015]|nr:conserved hypothetical protein [gamma proteobacterium HTCC5015]
MLLKFATKLSSFGAAALLLAVAPVSAQLSNAGQVSSTEFNPAVSLILDGRYTDYEEGLSLDLPGFIAGGEAGLTQRGFSTGHNELAMSANVDDRFYGQFNAAIVEHDGATELELEEAFIETLGLGNGFTVKGGRFFSGIGYLNAKHEHSYDFVDSPLVYQAMVGGKLADTGVQARWLAPTPFYMELGAELLSGETFPGGSTEDRNNANAAFVKWGGDIGDSSNWQLGLSYYANEFEGREPGGHHHGGGHEHGHGGGAHLEWHQHEGETDLQGLDFVYKWAPNGNPKERNLAIYGEFFVRNETAHVHAAEGAEEAEAELDGEQTGYYLAAVYQFKPKWRIGVRYDQLSADNAFNGFVGDEDGNGTALELEEFEEETGLGTDHADDPTATSLMLDYSHSHFSRIRLQYTDLDTGHNHPGEVSSGSVVSLQYLMSLGAHGAHSF